MKCVVVTPERTVFEQTVNFVVLPLWDGEFGVEASHSPVVARLGCGELRLTLADNTVERWFIEGGVVEVAHDFISILTNYTCRVEELDFQAAQLDLEKAIALPTSTPQMTEARDVAVRIARAKFSVARRVDPQRG